jgi:hypothetical protein
MTETPTLEDAKIRAQHAAMLEMQEPLARTLLAVRDALQSLPRDALGEGESGGACWPMRDELLTGVEHCLKLQRELKERSDALATQPQGREEIRAALAPFLGGSTRLKEATDAIMSLIPPAGLPVEASEEAVEAWARERVRLITGVRDFDSMPLEWQKRWKDEGRSALKVAYAIDARPVKVKALEWEEIGGEWGATNPINSDEYLYMARPTTLEPDGEPAFELYACPPLESEDLPPFYGLQNGCFGNLDALKKACDADFSRRVSQLVEVV